VRPHARLNRARLRVAEPGDATRKHRELHDVPAIYRPRVDRLRGDQVTYCCPVGYLTGRRGDDHRALHHPTSLTLHPDAPSMRNPNQDQCEQSEANKPLAHMLLRDLSITSA